MKSRDDSGAVTAEAAMVIPILVLVAFGLCWLVSLAVAQIKTIDAARETARSLAREDPRAEAVSLGRRVAPSGAEFTVEESGGLITVTVRAPIAAPGGLFRFPGFDAHAEVVAAPEGRSGEGR